MDLDKFKDFPLAAERVVILNECISKLRASLQASGTARVVAVCTHNSRRSQFVEVWLATALVVYNVQNVQVSSAGTEVTALAEGVVEQLKVSGFSLTHGSSTANPRFRISGFGMQRELYSKTIEAATESFNSEDGFMALMVCAAAAAAAAAENCPIVPGAQARISLTYQDPKAADGTLRAKEAYAKTSGEVAREMFYIAQRLSKAE